MNDSTPLRPVASPTVQPVLRGIGAFQVQCLCGRELKWPDTGTETRCNCGRIVAVDWQGRSAVQSPAQLLPPNPGAQGVEKNG